MRPRRLRRGQPDPETADVNRRLDAAVDRLDTVTDRLIVVAGQLVDANDTAQTNQEPPDAR